MLFRYKKVYLKLFDSLSKSEKELVILADSQIRNYYTTQTAPYGLRVKKLYASGKDKIFEARVSDKLRILWLEKEGLISFAFLGSHNELKNYIKNLH